MVSREDTGPYPRTEQPETETEHLTRFRGFHRTSPYQCWGNIAQMVGL